MLLLQEGRGVQPLHHIPVQKAFPQILELDIVDFPATASSQCMVFVVPVQKANRIVKLLTEEVIPFYGGPDVPISYYT